MIEREKVKVPEPLQVMEDEEETAEEEGTERNLETGGSWPPCRQRGSAGFRSLCCAANSNFSSYFSDGMSVVGGRVSPDMNKF